MGELIYFPGNARKRKAWGKHKRSSSCNTVQPPAISTAAIDLDVSKLLQALTSPNIELTIKLTLEMIDEK